MYKIICPKCEKIQLLPEEATIPYDVSCGHFNHAEVIKMKDDITALDRPLNIERIKCKVVRIP